MSQALLEQWKKEDEFQDIGKDNAPGVRAMFEASSDLNAQKVARSQQLAKSLGMPESVVLEVPEWAETENKARQVEKHPLLAKWAEEGRNNAAFVRDDTVGLASVFDSVGKFFSPKIPEFDFPPKQPIAPADPYGSITQTPNPNAFAQIPMLLQEGVEQVAGSVGGALVMMADRLQSSPDEIDVELPYWKEREAARNSMLRGFSSHVRKSMEAQERARSAPLQGESAIGGYTQDVVRMVPQILGAAGATAAAGPAGGLAFMGSQIAGGQYIDLTDKGVDPDRAAVAALANAGLQAPLEQIGLGKFMNIFKASGLGNVFKSMGSAIGTEALTEYLQAYPEAATNIWAEAQKEGRSTEESVAYFLDSLGDIHRSGLYSAAVAAPFGLLGGASRIMTDAATAREAFDFATRNKEIHAVVEASQTKQISPTHMASALESAGLTQNVSLPADAVLQLYQDGKDIITPMGWNMDDVADAASMGHAVEAKISHLHANLDAAQFDAVANMMRVVPSAMSVQDAAQIDTMLQEDADIFMQEVEQYEQEQAAFEQEQERIRLELASALASVPKIKTQLDSDSTLEDVATGNSMTPEKAADYVVGLHTNFARKLSQYGISPSEYLRKVKVDGMVRDENGRLVSMLELEESMELDLRNSQDREFVQAVRGRIDADKLRQDYPDAVRELSKIYGKNFFRRGGRGADDVAGEMETFGILPQGSGADGLIERLKQGKGKLYQGAADSLAADVAAWKQTVDAIVAADKPPSSAVPMLKQTPLVMQLLGKATVTGKAAAKGGIYAAPHLFDGTHRNMTPDMWKQIPGAMADPIAVFDSDSEAGRANGDLVFMLEVQDANGATVVVPVALGARGKIGASINLVKSAYAKESGGKPSNTWFISQAKKNARYINGQKWKKWGIGSGANSPLVASSSSGAKILTEADLVNLREQNPSLYQRYNGGARGMLSLKQGNKHYQSANESLAADVAAWEQTVDAFLDGSLNKRRSATMLNQTPLVLTLLGADSQKRVTTSYDTLRKVIVEKHRLPENVVKQVPAAMADPVMIFESATVKGDYVIMLDLKDEKGASIVVPISLDYDGVGGYAVNYVPSMYAKKDDRDGTANNRWFLNQIENGNLRYQNTKKSREWAKSSGLQLPRVGSHPVDGKTKIRTEADLVNLREQNPTLYQSYHGGARGGVEILPDAYKVQLFKGADLSTILHESGHIFYNEIESLVQSGVADESLTRDYQALRDWTAEFNDDASLKEFYDREYKLTSIYRGKPFRMLDIEEKEGVTARARTEKFARGFELYLREGKAPSKELETAFARFKKWLTRVYRQALSLRVELTDDVRGVFERLFATEVEIQSKAIELNLVDLGVKELDAMGIKGADKVFASGLMKAAHDAAAVRMQQDRDRGRKEQLKTWALEAKAETDKEPVYAMMTMMRREPLDLDAIKAMAGDDIAAKAMKRAPGSFKRDGLPPDLFAAYHGFDSVGAMLQAMLAAPPKKVRSHAIIQDKQDAHDAQYRPEDYLIETEEVAEQMAFVAKFLAESSGRNYADKEAVRRVAANSMASMPMNKARSAAQFRNYMAKSLREERRAIAKGDFGAALSFNSQARLNMEMGRMALDIDRGIDKLKNKVKAFGKSKQVGADAKYIVLDLASRFGFSRGSAALERGRDPMTITAWAKEAEEQGFDVFVDDTLLLGPGKDWRDMSFAEFENFVETLMSIMAVERNKHKIMTDENKASVEEVTAKIAASIAQNRTIKQENTVEEDSAIKKLGKRLHAIHTKVEALLISLDGGKLGPAWQYIFKPIADAENAQSILFKAARDELRGKKLFGAFKRGELARMGSKREYVKEIGESLSYENRLAVALNMGNEINISRIKEGHNWNDAQIAAVIKSLTKRDWDFVQSVWDYLETFKADSFKLQKDLTGVEPKAVEAQPVVTADGVYRGGYYPIRYHSEKSVRAFAQEQKELDKELFGGRNYGAAATKKGHLKERAKAGMGSPLLLELSVITDHTFNVIHDITHRKAVMDVAKILNNTAVQEAIIGSVGMDMFSELKPWLQDIANERQEPMHQYHRWAQWARSSTSIMNMGFKITTMLSQPLGITQTAEVIGYKWTGLGLKKVYSNPLALPKLMDETRELSAFMAGRMTSFDREVRDMTKQLKPTLGRFGWLDVVRDKAFVPMGYFQMSVDLPTWWGAYAKGIAENGGDSKKAVEYADSMVRMAQGSGSTKDLARVQRGDPLMRLFTMFYSYFNTFYNLAARRFTLMDTSPAAIFAAANSALLLWFIPAVMGELIAGRGPEDDEDEDKWEWAAMQIAQYPFQAVIGVRDVASGLFGDYGYSVTPAESAPMSFIKWANAVRKAIEEEDAMKLAKPTAEAAGYALNLPLKQAIISVGNVWDFVTGNDPEFYFRDLFFVKPESRR